MGTFTNEEIKFFVEAACGEFIEGCSIGEAEDGKIIVTEPGDKVHEVLLVGGMPEDQQDLLGQAEDGTTGCRMCLDTLSPVFDPETGMCYACWLWHIAEEEE